MGRITVPFGHEQIFSARNTATAHGICKLTTVKDASDRHERADTAEIGVAKEESHEESHAFSLNFLDEQSSVLGLRPKMPRNAYPIFAVQC